MKIWAVVVSPTNAVGQYIDTIWASIDAAWSRVELLKRLMAASEFMARVWSVEMLVEDAQIVEPQMATDVLPVSSGASAQDCPKNKA